MDITQEHIAQTTQDPDELTLGGDLRSVYIKTFDGRRLVVVTLFKDGAELVICAKWLFSREEFQALARSLEN